MDVVEYAKKQSQLQSSERNLRMGVVTELLPDTGRVTIQLGGDTTEIQARYLGSYQPQLNDTVIVYVQGSDVLVLGTTQRETSTESRDFTTDPITNTELADNAVDIDNIIDGAVARVKIAEEAINEALLAEGAVSETKITDDAITTSKISTNAIIGDHIQSRQIDAFHIVAGAITANEIASRTITADRIASNEITANEIAAGTLTSASGVFGTISANDITTGTLDASNVNIDNLTVDAAQITSGTISSARIPNLSANKITTGTLDASRIGGGTISGVRISIGATNTFQVNYDGEVGFRSAGMNTTLVDMYGDAHRITFQDSSATGGTLSLYAKGGIFANGYVVHTSQNHSHNTSIPTGTRTASSWSSFYTSGNHSHRRGTYNTLASGGASNAVQSDFTEYYSASGLPNHRHRYAHTHRYTI